jgi:NADH-quinone oxidoreductase subunit A
LGEGYIEGDLKELVFLLVFIVLSTAFAFAALIAGYICSPKAESDEKNSTYECGMKLFSDARIQFDMKFFNYAILFLIFDVETIFLFPFAINFCQLQLFALVEVAIFVALLIFALVFAIKKDVLRWQ